MRTHRVAIVGSGPAGLYAADALVRSAEEIEVDVFDRLPTPYGLVRYGVAPDHPRIKSIITALQRILENDRVRFLGDVAVGRDLSPTELDELYDAVIYATGASRDRRLGVPGEDLPGSSAATDLVSWYSGHPDSAEQAQFAALTAESVVVIGAGNVALDVARLLAKPAELLDQTDMPPAVLQRLSESRVRDVHIVCRRGPEHVKFTTKELRELAELDHVATLLDARCIPADDVVTDSIARANLKVLRELAQREVHAPARTIHFHFWRSPRAVLGAETVEGVEFDVVEPDPEGSIARRRTEIIAAGMVIRSVGYSSSPIEAMPFDPSIGRIPNDAGRVIGDDGEPIPGRYAAGWVKRGPSGVVGTNRACASDTVAQVLADLAGHEPAAAPSADVTALLSARGVHPVGYDGWLSIDRGEVERGAALGRARTKIPDWTTLRRIAATT